VKSSEGDQIEMFAIEENGEEYYFNPNSKICNCGTTAKLLMKNLTPIVKIILIILFCVNFIIYNTLASVII
jgi:hypothetical protein